jgi:hypothetical protein
VLNYSMSLVPDLSDPTVLLFGSPFPNGCRELNVGQKPSLETCRRFLNCQLPRRVARGRPRCAARAPSILVDWLQRKRRTRRRNREGTTACWGKDLLPNTDVCVNVPVCAAVSGRPAQRNGQAGDGRVHTSAAHSPPAQRGRSPLNGGPIERFSCQRSARL